MKLICKIVIRVLAVMLLLMAGWAVLFYFAMMNVVNDEVDDSLDEFSEQLIIRALSGEEMPSEDNGTNNQYYLLTISDAAADDLPQIAYYDEEAYIYRLDSEAPARVRRTVFRDSSGQYYLLTVATPTIEKDEVREELLFWTVALFFSMLVAVVAIISLVFYRSMRPLYVFLKWLDSYRLGQPNDKLENPTNVQEFARLNEVAVRSLERIEKLYEQQRQFTGNASHELQTPLAISINRLEMLMEDESFSPHQLEGLARVHSSLQDIVKLNKSMLLLSRIENGQFPDTEPVAFSRIFQAALEDYRLFYSHKNLEVELSVAEDFVAEINVQLAKILVTNLLKNAFVHTDQGCIRIWVGERAFAVANGPASESLDGDAVFVRFNKGKSQKKESSGLGLAIVRSICEQSALSVGYRFRDGFHEFYVEKTRI